MKKIEIKLPPVVIGIIGSPVKLIRREVDTTNYQQITITYGGGMGGVSETFTGKIKMESENQGQSN